MNLPRLLLIGLSFVSLSLPCKAEKNMAQNILSLFQSSDMEQAQDKGALFPEVLKNKNQEPITVRVSLSQQRAFVFVGATLALNTPISSGKRPGWTPEGTFAVTEKDPKHRSNVYGNFVDDQGHIIRAGVDNRIDSAPSGTHYQGAPMLYFIRLTDQGVGFHEGSLPGYPTSHGCIHLPAAMASALFEVVSIGTPVTIAP